MTDFLRAHNARLGAPLDEHDLADLAQDTTVIVLDKLESYAGRAPLEGWVYGVCTIEFRSYLRRQRRRPLLLDPLPIPAVDPAAVERRELRSVLRRALRRLGGVEADTIELKHFDHMTFDQMARRTGTSTNTLKTRYYRGLHRLGRILAGQVG